MRNHRFCPYTVQLSPLCGPSSTSKVLRSVEGKGYVNRELGTNDKRQMYFSLTEKGRVLLGSINCEEIETPELLKTLFGE